MFKPGARKGAFAGRDAAEGKGIPDREKHTVSQASNESSVIKSWPSFKKTAYLLLPLLIYFVVHDIAQFFFWAAMELVLSGSNERITGFCTRNAYTLQGIINGLAILIGTAAVWKKAKSAIEAEKFEKGQISDYCFLAGLAFCVSVGVNIFFTRAGLSEYSKTYESIHEMQYGVEFAAGLILYGIVSPLAEETVFRGLLYNRMKQCFQVPIALILSSLFFGLYHGNLVQAVYGTILGILIAYVYEKYHNFAAPVLFHAVANISIFTISYGDGFRDVSREVSLGIMALLFSAAGILLWRIKKK